MKLNGLTGDLPLESLEHKELTKEESEALIRKAFDLERTIKTKMVATHEAWWSLAESLHEFHEMVAWRLLGYETLEEFLAQPDLGMSRRSFFYAVGLWDEFGVRRELPKSDLADVPPTKAREVLPAVRNGDVALDKALNDARTLSYRDVVREYGKGGEKPGGLKDTTKADGGAKLDAETEPERVKCPTCKSWVDADQLPQEDD